LKFEGIKLPVDATTDAAATKDALSINAFDTFSRSAWNRQGQDHNDSLADELTAVDSSRETWIATLDPKTETAGASAEQNAGHSASVRSPAGHDDKAALASSIGRVMGALPAGFALPITFALLAILLGTVRCSWQTILLRRKLAHCRTIAAGPVRNLLDELLRLVPRAPEVLLLSAPGGSEPAAFGIARWTIVLPPRAAFDLSEDELRALLAHELAHLVRGDSIWLWISRLVCSCLAFQPLNHLARREWQRTAEFLCDNWAVSRTGAPLALARCLTEVASWRLTGPASAAILAATGRKSGLVDRIERLLDARRVFDSRNDLREQRRTIFAGAVVLACLAWCAPGVQLVAGGPPADGEPVSGAQGLAQVDARERENEFDDSQVAEVSINTEVAKARSSGEQPVDEEESQVETIEASHKNSLQSAASDNASMIEAIDSDLMALASDLEQLGPLLRENAAPRAVALAKRLRGEIVRLQQRREVLKALWRKSVK
jgi:beta-lactamase regulating signal transducer with metallopeptidase domain